MKNVEIAEGGIGRRLSGTKFILTDKPESDQMEVWVDEDDRKLARLYATSNGTYYPEEYDAYGFSSVTVSIHGGVANPDLPSIEMPDGTIVPALIPEIEMPDGTILPIDELFPDIAEDPLTDIGEVKVPDTVGEEGSSIVGIDPEDGYTYKVDVDENGNLDIEKVPTGISITPPTQTEYEFGQPINYDGMDVTLVDKDGNTVKTKEYPDGKVPLDDENLTKPDKTDEKGEAKAKGTWYVRTDFLDFDPAFVGGVHEECRWPVVLIGYYRRYDDYRFNGVALANHIGNGNMSITFGSADPNGLGGTIDSVTYKESGRDPITGEVLLEEVNHESSSFKVTSTANYTKDGKTVYYGGWGHGSTGSYLMVPTIAQQNIGNMEGRVMWEALYGKVAYMEQELSVSWNDIYSGEVYEDGTTIVTSDPYGDE